MFLAVIGVTSCAVYSTAKMGLIWRVPIVVLCAFITFAVAEAAGFHVGPQSTLWFVIALLTMLLLGAVEYFGYRSSKRSLFQKLGQTTVTGGTVLVRPATNDDLDLLAGWFGDPRFVVWWGGKPKSRVEVAAKYLGRDGSRQAFIIEAGGVPIGYAQVWCDWPPDGGIDIVLTPEAQGKGLGTEAVRVLAQHLRAKGWRRITIDPLAQNYRAIRAFEKAGFVKDRLKGEHVILAFP